MKKLFSVLVFVFILLSGCSSGSGQNNSSYYEKNKIVKSDEYIEIDDSTVKFLFKTDVKSKVIFSCGESKEELKVLKTIENFENKGLKIDGFIPGKKYFYKIESIGKNLRSSPIHEFTKMEKRTKYKNAEWARSAVFYEIFVRSFYDGDNDGVGDFKGLTQKIDYLKELGIDAVWLMPIFESPSYHGYDTTDYYKIQPAYGTNQDFIDFIKTAHKNGIRVIIDLVANHSGLENKWAKEGIAKKNSPYKNYYVWKDEFSTDELGLMGGSVWHRNGNGWYYALFWEGMPDLNYRNYVLREEIKKVAKYWMDPNGDGDFTDGVDGFRMDASMHIDSDMEVTHSWWREFNSFAKSINRDTFIVGENWTNSDEVAPFFKDFDSSFNFEFSLSEDKYKYQNNEIIKYLQKQYQKYRESNPDFIDSRMLTNHDMERVGSKFDGDIDLEKMAATVLMTLPGTPFIYYGEELGQKGSKPDECIREGFDWYKSANGYGMTNKLSNSYTTADDGISLEEEEGDSNSLYNHYKKLISIRTRQSKVLQKKIANTLKM